MPRSGGGRAIPAAALLEVNSTQAMLLAIRSGIGVGALPDYLVNENPDLVRVLTDLKAPLVDVYFVYPEELRNSKRVAVFRDFLLTRLADIDLPTPSARKREGGFPLSRRFGGNDAFDTDGFRD